MKQRVSIDQGDFFRPLWNVTLFYLVRSSGIYRVQVFEYSTWFDSKIRDSLTRDSKIFDFKKIRSDSIRFQFESSYSLRFETRFVCSFNCYYQVIAAIFQYKYLLRITIQKYIQNFSCDSMKIPPEQDLKSIKRIIVHFNFSNMVHIIVFTW